MTSDFRRLKNLNDQAQTMGEVIGNLLVDAFHLLALFAIGATIVWAAVFEFLGMVESGGANIEDILLLFIYLELGAMVGIYFKTNHMPVRFLIYVAMTALTRLLFGFVSVEHESDVRIVIVAGAILLLALAVLVVRYGSNRFPSHDGTRADKPAG
jgi:phosphate starvation-inducible membrane PsiE